MLHLNQKIAGLQPSKSVTLMEKTKAMQKTDPSIVNLTGGEPDFPTPERICKEVQRQLEAGFTHYTGGPGIPELREAIARKLQEENHAPYQASQVLVTPGAKFSVYLAVQAVLNPGDEAIWLTPGWVSYPSIIEASDGVPVAVHLKWDEDYRITMEALEAATTEKTRLLIINYPNNPTGKILTEADREVLAAYMRKYPDVILLSDEIYEKIIYPGYEVVSMASYPDLADRVIIVNGFSKSSAMTGWRLGYLACSDEIFKVVMKLFQHTMSCTSGFLQKAAVVALDCKEETEQMRQEYEKRSQILVAEGMKESAILKADAVKEQKIREAQGEAEAILTVQKANADALKMLNEASPTDRIIQLKSLEAFGKAADGKATKIIIPSDIQGLAGSVTAIKELWKDDVPKA